MIIYFFIHHAQVITYLFVYFYFLLVIIFIIKNCHDCWVYSVLRLVRPDEGTSDRSQVFSSK